jgi:hypothetical protein
MANAHRELEQVDVRDNDAENCSADRQSDDDYYDYSTRTHWGSGVPGPLYRFRNAGNLALSVGVVAGIVAYSGGMIPAWAGFLAGTLATVVASAAIQAGYDARRSARRTTSSR